MMFSIEGHSWQYTIPVSVKIRGHLQWTIIEGDIKKLDKYYMGETHMAKEPFNMLKPIMPDRMGQCQKGKTVF